MTVKRFIIIGAAGVAREVRWLLESLAESGAGFSFAGFVVSDVARLGPLDSVRDVRGNFEWLRAHRNDFDALALGIGNPKARLRVAEALEPEFGPELWPALVHPKAHVDRGTCTLEHGTVVQAGAVLTVHVTLRAFAMVHAGATVGHEAELGRACAVYPGANVGGGVRLGEGVLVGSGAQVLQYLNAGTGAVIGAGAVVTRDVAREVTVVGVPAKPTE